MKPTYMNYIKRAVKLPLKNITNIINTIIKKTLNIIR